MMNVQRSFRSFVGLHRALTKNLTTKSSAANRLQRFQQQSTVNSLSKSSLFSNALGLRTVNSSQIKFYSSQAQVQLSDFLSKEIEAEKDLAKSLLPDGKSPTVPGFTIKLDDADVILSKTHNDEKVMVYFNVNHTVDTHNETEDIGNKKPEELEEGGQGQPLVSMPDFRVEIAKSNQKFVFECQIFKNDVEAEQQQGPEGEETTEDLFNINEVYIYAGDSADKVYAASGEIIDADLYDHLMDYLAERGIQNAFVESLIKFATHYEHALYVGLLQKIKEFVAK